MVQDVSTQTVSNLKKTRICQKNRCDNVNVEAKDATNARLHSVCLPTLLFKRNATERHIVHG